MRSKLTQQFRSRFSALSVDTQVLARQCYKQWEQNPKHPGLHFKRVYPKQHNVWSVRIGANFRALALVEDDTAKWFWIGTHKEYDRILANLNVAAKGAKPRKS